MLTWVALVLLTFSSAHVAAQTPHVNKIFIVEKGIYRADTLQKTERKGTTGAINTVGGVKLLHNTINILGSRGVRFGFRYIITGAPNGAAVELRAVTKFPPAGLRNPETRKTYLQNAYSVIETIGDTAYREYYLEYDWEIVPGLWTFEFWYRDRKVGEQSFCVYRTLPGVDSAPAGKPQTICTDPLLG